MNAFTSSFSALSWRTAAVWLGVACGLVAGAAQAAEPAPEPATVRLLPARQTIAALQAPLLAVGCAGARQVALGEHGVILLSDDGGRQWRQARTVPVDVVLTSLSFVDAQHGWAVGHWGVVLGTSDGGETWQLLRSDTAEDRPLFAVHFFDREVGVAVGLWSTVLTTTDGGRTWAAGTTGLSRASGNADLNLYGLFASDAGMLYATAERGVVLRSDDRGQRWEALSTGAKGSLWTGLAMPGGRLVAAGLRGALWLSDDDGQHWRAVPTEARESITGVTLTAAQRIEAVGSDGLQLISQDGGRTFSVVRRPDRLPLTAIAQCGGSDAAPTIVSVRGPLPPGR